MAVLRALALGDLLCAVPMLRALRGLWPGAEVTLIGLPWARCLSSRYPDLIDAFLEFPGWPGLPERDVDAEGVDRFLREARERQFDLVVQAHGDGRITNDLVVRLGAARLAGFHPPGAPSPGPSWLAYPDDRPEPLRLLALAAHLGADDLDARLTFPLSAADLAEAASLRRALGIAERAYACLHPGSSTEVRRWPAERFARVAGEIASRDLRVVLTGSADEEPLARAVASAAGTGVVSAVGRTSLGGLAALLAGSRLLVTNDTGVSHLAAALGIRSVVVFSASDPARWAPLARDLHLAVGRGLEDGDALKRVGHEGGSPRTGAPPVGEVLAAVRRQLLVSGAAA